MLASLSHGLAKLLGSPVQIDDVCIDLAKAFLDLNSVVHSWAIFEGVSCLVTNNARALGIPVNIVSELHDCRIELT